MDNIWENYGSWLVQHVGFKKRGYSKMLRQLHGTSFHYVHPMDENRAVDGVRLRWEFLDEFKSDDVNGAFDCDCSVLEMMIALAIRCDNEYIGDPRNPRPDQFFWKMCENLGLDQFKNQGFSKVKEAELDAVLQNWMHHNYDFRGNGGLFPVKKTERDHRKLEIWSQMMEFISENY